MSNTELKVDAETAELDFDRFLEEMDIDGDTSQMDEKDRNDFESHKRVLIRAIQRGSLVIQDNGEPTFTPVRTEQDPITFHEPTGATFKSTDKLKAGQDFGRLLVIMGEMTGQHPNYFSKLKNADFKVVTAVTTLFLA